MKTKRSFKITKLQDEYIMYPFPVIKDKKYLITDINIKTLKILNILYNNELISDFISDEIVVFDKLHNDGKTHIYKLNTPIKLKLFTNSAYDSQKARIVEELLNKKIQNCINELTIQNIYELDKSLNNFSNCSTCKSLGLKKYDNLKIKRDLQIIFKEQ